MFSILRERLRQKHRTIEYPSGPPPELSERFAGRPVVSGPCDGPCDRCAAACPTGALVVGPGGPRIDTGRCLFCRDCERACPEGRVTFTGEYRLAASSREDLVVASGSPAFAPVLVERARALFGRSLKLRQVSAGGCNACEAECNVLGTPAWDFGRFGIQFVASPRHADGLLITGPVTANMAEALRKTYQAVPAPKIVIAVGACAISGGPYIGHAEAHDGAASVVPVDIYVPGCPPEPLTILAALLSTNAANPIASGGTRPTPAPAAASRRPRPD